MTILNEIPFIRILLPFLLGVFGYLNLQINVNLYWWLFVLLVIIICVQLLVKKFPVNTFKITFGILTQVFLMVLGHQLSYAHNAKNTTSHYTNNLRLPDKLIAQVVSIPVKGEKTIKAELSLEKGLCDTQLKSMEGKILGYFSVETKQTLHYGDVLLIDAKLRETEEPKNPGAFDYKEWLARKNIFHTVYVSPKQFCILNQQQVNPIEDLAISIKLKLLHLLKQNKLEGQELAIASSLLLGYDEEIDKNLSNAYAITGTVHVLSVSGLHIGIVFLVLNALFAFLDKRKSGIFLKGILVLGGVWLFALVSGFSPSVVRAAVMFSLFIIGKTFRWQGNTFNTLLASAFLILLFNPFLVYDIGFQLSYLALGGILFFQPYIYKWFEFENYFSDKIWALTAVSLAAQLTTFPLTIYYFNNFSVSFIIANLLIIPLSTCIMYGGILVLATSFIPTVSSFLAMLLKWIIVFMNESALFLSKIPGAALSGLYIHLHEMLLIYIVLLFISAFFISRTKKYLTASLVSLLLLLISFNASLLKERKDELIVYHEKGKSSIELFSGNTAVLIGEENQHSKKYELMRHIHQRKTLSLKKDCLIKINGFTFLVPENSSTLPPMEMVDVVLLSGNKKLRLQKLNEKFPEAFLVADGSNKNSRLNKWNNVADSLHLKFWSTAHKGAFRIQKDETAHWR